MRQQEEGGTGNGVADLKLYGFRDPDPGPNPGPDPGPEPGPDPGTDPGPDPGPDPRS